MDFQTLSGAVFSAFVSRLICFPIDTITVRRQTMPVKYTVTAQHRGTIALVRSYYQGFSASLVAVTPATVIYLTVYRCTKDQIKEIYPNSPFLTYIGGALTAEFVSSCLWTPMEVIKARAQISTETGVISKVRTLFKEEGISGFFRGYLVGLAIYMPYSAIWWASYEKTKNWMASKSSSWANNYIGEEGAAFFAAGIITVMGTCIFAPFELIKTRYQVATSKDFRLHHDAKLIDNHVMNLSHTIRNQGNPFRDIAVESHRKRLRQYNVKLIDITRQVYR